MKKPPGYKSEEYSVSPTNCILFQDKNHPTENAVAMKQDAVAGCMAMKQNAVAGCMAMKQNPLLWTIILFS
jgi:hypothetical protein